MATGESTTKQIIDPPAENNGWPLVFRGKIDKLSRII